MPLRRREERGCGCWAAVARGLWGACFWPASATATAADEKGAAGGSTIVSHVHDAENMSAVPLEGRFQIVCFKTHSYFFSRQMISAGRPYCYKSQAQIGFHRGKQLPSESDNTILGP